MSEENKILLQADSEVSSPKDILDSCRLSVEAFDRLSLEASQTPDDFWGNMAREQLEWFTPFKTVLNWTFPTYTWFEEGELNITHNCLDRHVRDGKRHQLAYLWVGEDGKEKKLTYGELLNRVSRLANGLKSLGIQKGDTVTIYMPLIVEQLVAMLACARIGAIHSVVFGGFSAAALKLRIEDARSKVVITASWTRRRGKKVDLKSVVDEAVGSLGFVEKVIVAQREGDNYELLDTELDFHQFMWAQKPHCPPTPMKAEDPLFILYTSGTTGKPKGVLHTVGGYSLWTHVTTGLTFDLRKDDLFWCSADPGWITGHSYIVYGPLSNGVSSLVSEGSPDYPDPGRWWMIVQKYGVNVFYTAPTAVRLFMKHGDEWPKKYDLSSLRILGSVGEPINPEAWQWYYKHIGQEKCAIVDTWWQTETGGHMITTIPSMTMKPGRAGRPYFGVDADVVDKAGNRLPPNTVGHLIIRRPWPSALRTCWGEHERFEKYWTSMPGQVYYAGDLATKDEAGYIMILGRADDVLNVSGHRIGTAEVESALVSHSCVAESAVIGRPHEVKGESIKAFVVLIRGVEAKDTLKDNIRMHVRHELGALAVPDDIEFLDKLPKTRSGKIMRRVLKAQELGMDVGDTSTLED